MERKEPILFKVYPNLKNKVPWISLLTNIPTPIDRLTALEKKIELKGGEIYIKRDDKDHNIYGGNKLRKFEFIFGDAVKKKKKGMASIGGIGTNHGLACAIVTKDLGLKCHLFLFPQPLTWHVQRSLLLYDHFGAKLHLSKGFLGLTLKSLLFQITHPKYYLMLPGGTPLFGLGTSLGTVGFINAFFELNDQIKKNEVPKPDVIFVAGGSTGTAAGLMAGCKLLGLEIKFMIVAVGADFIANVSTIIKNANKAIKYLREFDSTIPDVNVTEDDFELIEGFLGSEYGIKTIRSQDAVDTTNQLEGKKRDFKLETTYTGKVMAALFNYLEKEENKSKKVMFWNTYNSNDLSRVLTKTYFNWKKLPKKFHKFYENTHFQCWEIKNCPKKDRDKCHAYLNHEYRCWLVNKCSREKRNDCKAFKDLSNIIKLEDA